MNNDSHTTSLWQSIRIQSKKYCLRHIFLHQFCLRRILLTKNTACGALSCMKKSCLWGIWFQCLVWFTNSLVFKYSLITTLAFIIFSSSLVLLIEGLCSSNPWEIEFSGFSWIRTDDLEINSPLLWPSEPRLHASEDTFRKKQKWRKRQITNPS